MRRAPLSLVAAAAMAAAWHVLRSGSQLNVPRSTPRREPAHAPPPPLVDNPAVVPGPAPVVEPQPAQPADAPSQEPFACRSKRLRDVTSPECGAAAKAAAADEAADVATLQAALLARQHPADCAARPFYTFKDWRNGLGSQLSSLVGAWASLLHKGAAGGRHVFVENAPLLVPAGGLRYANKALCPRRDLACYFEAFSGCEAPAGTKAARTAKTPPELSERVSSELRLRRTRDKWWLRKELTRYVFRINAETRGMLERVRAEMMLKPPAAAADASAWLRTDQLVALHVRRGDKRDLGAKERGEPFSDAMYVKAALALADEVGAEGFLLASSEPETLRRLPPLLAPRPTYVMPGKYFVHVPEGLTPHQVIERTKQEGGGNDEGRSQIVQLLLLAESRAFLGTATSNFGLLVTKLMAFSQPSPVALDLSCAGLAAMRDGGEAVWPLAWADAKDARRCSAVGGARHVAVAPRRKANIKKGEHG